LISSTASSGFCIGTTIEARSRSSRSSHSRAIQSLIARAKAAPMSSLNSACAPYRQLQMASLVPNGANPCAASACGVVAALPVSSRQSARAVSGLRLG